MNPKLAEATKHINKLIEEIKGHLCTKEYLKEVSCLQCEKSWKVVEKAESFLKEIENGTN